MAAEGRLAGQSAVITGATRGIGLECARLFLAEGARVAILGRHRETLTQVEQELEGNTVAIRCDMADPVAVQEAIAAVRHALGAAPDILLNNAGAFFLAAVERTSVADFERTLHVNVTASFALVRAFLPDLRAHGRGHIVTIGSIADRTAFAENAAYAASKYATRGLHEVLREETRGSGVRVTLVSPGPVNTALWDPVDPDAREGFTPRAAMLDAAAVAEAVRFAVTAPPALNVDELRLSRA